MPKHTILFLAANPSGTNDLAQGREARAIETELARGSHGDQLELVTRWAAQPTDLRTWLQKLRPTVVHFSGHGMRSVHSPIIDQKMEPGLYFEAADGSAQYVPVTALQAMFAAAGASVRLVVLNACYSDTQAEALLAHTACALGFAGSQHTTGARCFLVGFYGALAEGQSIAAAFAVGCATVALEGWPESDRPRLMVRNGVDAGQLFLVEASTQPVAATAKREVHRENDLVVRQGVDAGQLFLVKASTQAAAGTAQRKIQFEDDLMVRQGMEAGEIVLVEASKQPAVETELRDVQLEDGPGDQEGSGGRNLIAVIGIDRYSRWQRLKNAVSDAMGAATLFKQLGFQQASPALIDDAATGRALRSLVMDELRTLKPNDSLVLFYAGHGGNQKDLVGEQEVLTGYLIPFDAEHTVATWIDLKSWLEAIARLPPLHILVILDACHSGIALDPASKWLDRGSDDPLSTLRTRRSRRIITSALGSQRAMDGGPYPEHSLFTGCLIDALRRGLRKDGARVATGSELGVHLQRRVESYPGSNQTPDFGTFLFDNRGELVISLCSEPQVESDDAAPEPERPERPEDRPGDAGEPDGKPHWRLPTAFAGIAVALGLAFLVRGMSCGNDGPAVTTSPVDAAGPADQPDAESPPPNAVVPDVPVRIDASLPKRGASHRSVDARPPSLVMDAATCTEPYPDVALAKSALALGFCLSKGGIPSYVKVHCSCKRGQLQQEQDLVTASSTADQILRELNLLADSCKVCKHE